VLGGVTTGAAVLSVGWSQSSIKEELMMRVFVADINTFGRYRAIKPLVTSMDRARPSATDSKESFIHGYTTRG
jgi:hypothetical protein